MTPFSIKLISGRNLVLVESCDYGSEIFMPEIVDGIIHLRNVIPHRRRPHSVLTNTTNKINILNIKNLKKPILKLKPESISRTINITPKGTDSTIENSVISSGSSIENSVTSSGSSGYFSTNSVDTPPAIRACSKVRTKHSTPVLLPDILSEQSFTPPHNLIARGKLGTVAGTCSTFTPSPILSLSLNKPKPKLIHYTSLGPNVKIVKLYRKSADKTLNNAANIVHVCTTPKRNNTTFASPAKLVRKPPGPTTPGTVTKWRKCLTPAKTYSKHGNIKKERMIIRSAKKSGMTPYIPRPTAGITGHAEVEVKNIRTTIDARKIIGPREFKCQLRSSDDLKCTEFLNVRTREQYYNARFSAFDLLVNPSRKKQFSRELLGMFRRRCAKKYAPLESKYTHLLDDIPPLDYIPPFVKRCSLQF